MNWKLYVFCIFAAFGITLFMVIPIISFVGCHEENVIIEEEDQPKANVVEGGKNRFEEKCGLSDEELCDVFDKHAGCFGINQIILEELANMESGMETELVTKKKHGIHVGLFQIKVDFCSKVLKKTCTVEMLKDISLNTYLAALEINSLLRDFEIVNADKFMSLEDMLALFYFGWKRDFNTFLRIILGDDRFTHLEILDALIYLDYTTEGIPDRYLLDAYWEGKNNFAKYLKQKQYLKSNVYPFSRVPKRKRECDVF
jgi:hypothetical protein